MNATLTKQFEGFAECCLELARSAETTERRARFIQMADEYRLATLLTSEELPSCSSTPARWDWSGLFRSGWIGALPVGEIAGLAGFKNPAAPAVKRYSGRNRQTYIRAASRLKFQNPDAGTLAATGAALVQASQQGQLAGRGLGCIRNDDGRF